MAGSFEDSGDSDCEGDLVVSSVRAWPVTSEATRAVSNWASSLPRCDYVVVDASLVATTSVYGPVEVLQINEEEMRGCRTKILTSDKPKLRRCRTSLSEVLARNSNLLETR